MFGYKKLLSLTVLSLFHIGTLFSLMMAAPLADPAEKVLIRTPKPYTRLVAEIEAQGGKVRYQYKQVDAIAAEIPRSSLGIIRGMVGPHAISKDALVASPGNIDIGRGKAGLSRTSDGEQIQYDSVEGIAAANLPTFAAARPNAYLINNSVLNLNTLHAAGIAGSGVIVAVIDSGIRPGFPHISLGGSVIGGEDFVEDGLGFSNSANNGHGTFVAGVISANAVFGFNPAGAFFQSVTAHLPEAILAPNLVPMIGSAPLSSIFALRVFGPTGGAPTSRILAAVDRVIELREKFDAGLAGGLNIQVCNMSLGGTTLLAGRDLFDTAVDVMLEKGIVLVVSASNAGPASLTIGSPGSSFGAITVGAASHAPNERILRDVLFGLGIGSLFRPFGGTQTAFFSSRGPNADGRIDPDVTASGFGIFGQGFSPSATGISLASGTSFSAPSVAGLAALLRQAFPTATARQIRNAIIASANPAVLTDGSTELDQGNGFVDAQSSFNLLNAGRVPDPLPTPPGFSKNVRVNVEQGTFLNVRDGVMNQRVTDLKPGQRTDILYHISPDTGQVIIRLSNVTAALPPGQQNVLFGDDILLTVHSAKTSAIGEGDYRLFEFTTGGTFVIDSPESGLMRITISGDWTNAGAISADVTIFSVNEGLPQFTSYGKIGEFQTLVFPVSIPEGVSKAEFRLIWREDWSNYPPSDLDLVLMNPDSVFNFDGATLNDPELAVVNNPVAGTWLVLVDGFSVPAETDQFELRVSLDGKVIK